MNKRMYWIVISTISFAFFLMGMLFGNQIAINKEVDPYAICIQTSKERNFAGEVCEPLTIGYKFPVEIQEDDPNWDCRTMGNKLCGWSYLDDEYIKAIANSPAFDYPVEWEKCLIHYGDRATIICPNGLTIHTNYRD